MWAEDTWRKNNTMINEVIKKEPEGKRPLGRLHLRRENCGREKLK